MKSVLHLAILFAASESFTVIFRLILLQLSLISLILILYCVFFLRMNGLIMWLVSICQLTELVKRCGRHVLSITPFIGQFYTKLHIRHLISLSLRILIVKLCIISISFVVISYSGLIFQNQPTTKVHWLGLAPNIDTGNGVFWKLLVVRNSFSLKMCITVNSLKADTSGGHLLKADMVGFLVPADFNLFVCN